MPAGRLSTRASVGPAPSVELVETTGKAYSPRLRVLGRVRLRLDLGYDGSAFSGWASQPGLRRSGRAEAAWRQCCRSARLTVVRPAPTPECAGAARFSHLRRRGDPDRLPGRPVRRPRRRAGPRRAGTPGRRGAGRLRCAVLRDLAPLRLSGRRQRGALDPLHSGMSWSGRALDLDAMNEAAPALLGCATSRRSGAARRRHHDPDLLALGWSRADAGLAVGDGSGPTPSATTWCARSWAACSRSAPANGAPRGPAEVLWPGGAGPRRAGFPPTG